MEEALGEAGDDPGLQARIHTEMAWAVPENFVSTIAHADAAISLLDGGRDPARLAQAAPTAVSGSSSSLGGTPDLCTLSA